jgi:hypothetical protein
MPPVDPEHGDSQERPSTLGYEKPHTRMNHVEQQRGNEFNTPQAHTVDKKEHRTLKRIAMKVVKNVALDVIAPEAVAARYVVKKALGHEKKSNPDAREKAPPYSGERIRTRPSWGAREREERTMGQSGVRRTMGAISGQLTGRNMLSQRERRIQEVIATASDAFKKEGFELSTEDTSLIADSPPKKESFPIFIFMFALLKDFIDIFGATGIGLIITIPLSLISLAVIVIWGLGKLKHGFWKKAFVKGRKKWLIKRLGASQFMELIPYINLFPTNAFFIVLIYNKEKAIVKLFDNLLNSLHDAGAKL